MSALYVTLVYCILIVVRMRQSVDKMDVLAKARNGILGGFGRVGILSNQHAGAHMCRQRQSCLIPRKMPDSYNNCTKRVSLVTWERTQTIYPTMQRMPFEGRLKQILGPIFINRPQPKQKERDKMPRRTHRLRMRTCRSKKIAHWRTRWLGILKMRIFHGQTLKMQHIWLL